MDEAGYYFYPQEFDERNHAYGIIPPLYRQNRSDFEQYCKYIKIYELPSHLQRIKRHWVMRQVPSMYEQFIQLTEEEIRKVNKYANEMNMTQQETDAYSYDPNRN